MIRIGPKARLHGLRAELHFANLVLLGILLKYNAAMVLTHGMDGTHTRASIHYAGGAEDLTFTIEVTPVIRRAVVNEWKANAGPDMDIVFEEEGLPNEHVHAEWQPKESY